MDCFPSVHVGMAVKSARQTLPRTLMPVIDSMLAEMGGLGFIDLFLGVTLTDGIMGDVVAVVSEEFLGDEEILPESFSLTTMQRCTHTINQRRMCL